MSESDKFWLQDPSVLIRNFMYFIPTKNMTSNQVYNAITLFCVYFSIFVIILKKPKEWVYIPVFIVIIMIMMFSISTKKIKQTENFDNIIESGFIDSNNTLQFKRTTGEPLDGFDLSYSVEKPQSCGSCRRPTIANPFMNPSVADYNTSAPVACNADDEEIKDEIKRTFSHDLYMNIDDVFEKANSQRQFYTVPNTSIPNDQEDFANWLYRSPATCKTDQEQCLRYEDLRFKR